MAEVRFEWLDEGFREILNSPELAEVCLDAAKEIEAKATAIAGAEFEAKPWHSSMKGGRVAAIVAANSYKARKAEAEDKALSKAVEQCRKS